MKKKIKILELFGGIGAPRQALLNLGFEIDKQSDYIENDRKVVDIYNKMFDTNHEPVDVMSYTTGEVEVEVEKEHYDLLVAGFPCQPFSQGGKRLGFDDPRGKLYKEALRIIKETLPENIILENVKGIYEKEFSIDNLQEGGNKIPVLETFAMTNFIVIPRKSDGELINGSYNRVWKIDKKVGTIASSNIPKIGIPYKGMLYYRQLTTKEAFNMMGFSDEVFEKVKDCPKSTLTHVIGNSMVVGIIELILNLLLN